LDALANFVDARRNGGTGRGLKASLVRSGFEVAWRRALNT
jgi:hypothetical protein